MRGADVMQGAMFSYVTLEDRILVEHPLRRLRVLVDAILASMSDPKFRFALTGVWCEGDIPYDLFEKLSLFTSTVSEPL